MLGDPIAAGIERATRIFAAEHRQCVGFWVRVSLRILRSLFLPCSNVMAGSSMIAASTAALLHGRNRGGLEPDADDGDRIGIDAVLAQHVFEEEIGRGAGRADADLLAGQILDAVDRGLFGRDHQGEAGIAVIDHERFQRLVLGREIDAVVEIAGDNVGAAAEHRGERLRAALEVDQFDVEPGLLVLAELLGEHRRQVAQAAGAADRNRHLGLRERATRGEHQRAKRDEQPPDNTHHEFLPGPPDHSPIATACPGGLRHGSRRPGARPAGAARRASPRRR